MTVPARVARRRRKFAFGVLEQSANILGAIAASVLVVGVLLPALAAAAGMHRIAETMFDQVVWLVVGFALLAGAGSLLLRGLARLLESEDPDNGMGDG